MCVDSFKDDQQTFLYHNYSKLKVCEQMNSVCKNPKKNIDINKCHRIIHKGPFESIKITSPTTRSRINQTEKDLKSGYISKGN